MSVETMNFLSIREIINRKIIKLNGRPIVNHNTIKAMLADLGIRTVRKGNRTYYIESDLYRKLEIEVIEVDS